MRERRRNSLSEGEKRKKLNYSRYLNSISNDIKSVEDLKGEVWRPVVGIRHGFVSNKGRVKSRMKGRENILAIKRFYNVGRADINRDYIRTVINVPKSVYESFVIGKKFEGVFRWKPLDGDYSNYSVENISLKTERKPLWHKIPKYKLDAIMDAFWTQHDNRDSVLAEQFSVNKSILNKYISHKLDEHFNKINNR